MTLVDELQKLEQLRSSGTLSEEEFAQAKRKLLSSPSDEQSSSLDARDNQDESLGRAANRYVSFQIVTSVIGLIVFLFFLFAVILPNACNRTGFHGDPFQHVEWKTGP